MTRLYNIVLLLLLGHWACGDLMGFTRSSFAVVGYICDMFPYGTIDAIVRPDDDFFLYRYSTKFVSQYNRIVGGCRASFERSYTYFPDNPSTDNSSYATVQ